MLMTLGDSHALFNFAGVGGLKIYWRSGVTMHRAARDGIMSLKHRTCRPKPSDILIISFGEIDSRAHIPRLAKANGRSSIAEADILCDRFHVELNEFRKIYPATTIALSCIIPFNPDSLEPQHYASAAECLADAKAIRDHMNNRLTNMGVPFVDFRSGYSNGDGSIRKEYSDENVHIDARHSKPVIDALKSTFGLELDEIVPPWPPYPRAEPDLTLVKEYRRAIKNAVKAPFIRVAKSLQAARQ